MRWQEERRAPYEAARAGGQEVRIAAALTLTDITSSDLAALIAEVEAAPKPLMRTPPRPASRRSIPLSWSTWLVWALLWRLRSELRVYPTMVAKPVNILSRIPAIDAEVSRINGSAPPGVKDRLLGVEQKARGVEGFGVSGAWDSRGLLALAADLKLPKFE